MDTPTLLRRHRPACAAGRPVDSYSTEAEERRQGWKKCRCKIYAHGTLNGIFKKLATRARDWGRAREALAPYLAAGRWDIDPSTPPPSTSPGPPSGEAYTPDPESGISIADAVKTFLKDHEDSKSAENTILKYRRVLDQLSRFASELGLRYLTELTRPYLRQLVAHWRQQGNDPLTVQKKLSVLKSFFEPYAEDKILAENPARFKTRRNRALRVGGSATHRQKNPFTDEELKRMLDGCSTVGRTELRQWPKKVGGRQVVAITEYRDYHRKWTGEDLADFIQLSYFTGLRISDVATFDISRLTPSGEVNLRATKNGEWVSVWIPEWLATRLHQRALRLGSKIFGEHSTTDINVITDVWRRKLNLLWARTGPWQEKPTHHRFRHTFVRILLQRGVSVSFIAALAGDTEQMIRRHYSAWMPERQESASRILREAFRDVPRFSNS